MVCEIEQQFERQSIKNYLEMSAHTYAIHQLELRVKELEQLVEKLKEVYEKETVWDDTYIKGI